MLQLIERQASINEPPAPSRLADPELLADIANEAAASHNLSPNSDRVQLFSRLLHDIRIGGAWKRTGGGRLPETQSALIRNIAPQYREKLTLLDLGASDGITTVELVRSLRARWHGELTAYLTDRNLWLHRYRLGPLVEYRAVDGEPVMARIGRVGLRVARQRHTEGGTYTGVERWYLGFKALRKRLRFDAAISLVNPIATSEPGVVVKEMDCLCYYDDLVGKLAAIRASNVLNLGYFTTTQVQQAVQYMRSYLADDGCLVISRNSEQAAGEVENGSVWLKRKDRLEWIEDFGSGSEIREIVGK
jgi:hypothetical protein